MCDAGQAVQGVIAVCGGRAEAAFRDLIQPAEAVLICDTRDSWLLLAQRQIT